MAYAMNSDDYLPSECSKNDISLNFTRSEWWPNAVAPYLSGRTYAQISGDGNIPLPPDKSIYVCPSAKIPKEAPYPVMGSFPQPWNRYFFCYVWNSRLGEGKTKDDSDNIRQVKLMDLERLVETVFMLEIRTTRDELPAGDPYYDCSLARFRANWKRFAARHAQGARRGGHVAFCDGHVGFVSNELATTNKQGSRSPNFPHGDWNKDGLIWNAFGPAH